MTRFMNMISEYMAVNDPRYVLFMWGQVAVIAVIFLYLRSRKPKWYPLGIFILTIWFVRCLLFGSPLIWERYNQWLSVDDVGWRQQSAINVEYYKFFKYSGKKYLAVGSSQTYSLYQEYSKTHPGITVFNLAGMTPIDLYLYRDYIAARHPEYILLYLSEFDLAKEPSLTAAKIAPAQGLGFFKHYAVYRQIAQRAKTELALKEMAVGEWFPEYKYSFVFKGLLQKWLKKNEALRVGSLYDSLQPDDDKLKKEISGTLDEFNEESIPFQIYFLKAFLEYCQANQLKVVIIEGQYNPLMRNEKTARLNQLTVPAIEGLARQYEHVYFVPKNQTMELAAADFDDSVHVSKGSAKRFVDALLIKLSVFDQSKK